MTAIVGILNRNGVAFAADSAATHTLSPDNKKKITNHANKVFELSKFKPIGVAICGSLSFMGIPWEDIFKLYRAQLEKTSFPLLKDYVFDFIRFVKASILSKFVDEQKQHLCRLSLGLKNEIINIAVQELGEHGNDEKALSGMDIFPIMSQKLKEFIGVYSNELMKNGKDFDGYTLDDFLNYGLEDIRRTLSDLVLNKNCPNGFDKLFTEALFHILVSKNHVYLAETEVIFWGFGDDDLFPQCHPIKISAAFDGRIKWSDGNVFSVSNSSPAWIIPFAQTDVSNTVVRGVDQSLREKFSENASDILEKFKRDLVKKLEDVGAPEEFKDALSSFVITPYTDLYTKEMDLFIQQNYIDKLMDTVSCLMKEDLADMAESLVRMTCLKRHFTTDEETVGGPVDVAVATRGDGFVWIKRKHYFSADLNHHYFER